MCSPIASILSRKIGVMETDAKIMIMSDIRTRNL